MEFFRYMPPKIPKHPLQDIEANMNELLTYSAELSLLVLRPSASKSGLPFALPPSALNRDDLKLRWQFTTRFSTSRMGV